MRRVPLASIGLGAVALLALLTVPGSPQTAPAPNSEASRIDARIKALEREADDLAGRARTVLGELQKLEVERALRREQAARAEAAAQTAMGQLRQASQRVVDLEQ